MPTWIGGEIVPLVSYGIAAAAQSEAAILANALLGATRISVPGRVTGNWEFTDVDYFRLDLPDAGVLTLEEDLLGDLSDDSVLVMAFGFPNGESSIWAEEDSQLLTGGARGPAYRLNPRILRRGLRRPCRNMARTFNSPASWASCSALPRAPGRSASPRGRVESWIPSRRSCRRRW